MTSDKSPIELAFKTFSDANMQTVFMNYNTIIYENHLLKLKDDTDEKIDPLFPGIHQPILFHIDDDQVGGESFNINHLSKIIKRITKNPSKYFITYLAAFIILTPKKFVCYIMRYSNEVVFVVYCLCCDNNDTDDDDKFIIVLGLDNTSHMSLIYKLSDNDDKCAFCKSKDKLLRCKACNTVQYCNNICQKAHWKIHKPTCKLISIVSNNKF